MSEFGPLPEQPTEPDARIPQLDLRERIRLDHRVPPITPLGKVMDQQGKAAGTQSNEMMVAVVLVFAVIFLWSFHPAWVLILGLVCLTITSIAKLAK
jgi:hypothetical protein